MPAARHAPTGEICQVQFDGSTVVVETLGDVTASASIGDLVGDACSCLAAANRDPDRVQLATR